MRYTAVGSIVLVCVVSCDYDYPRLAPGEVKLRASPSVFVLHVNDTRETTLTLSNGTGQVFDVPSEFTAPDLVGATMTFTGNTCGAQLSAGTSCSATGNLVATDTGQTVFRVSFGATSTMLSMTAMPACPANCGPSGGNNCCLSSVVPGNAMGASLAGEAFYRSYDMAADQMYPSKTASAEISDFRLDTYEVTVGRFRAFVTAGMGNWGSAPARDAGAHAQIPDSGWDPAWNKNLVAGTADLVAAVKCDATRQTWTDDGANDSLPMNCITWYEAMAFCIWDRGYLPSEAEWNYTASGGSEQRPYPWSSDGSTKIDCSYANYNGNVPSACVGLTNRVGSESPKGDGQWGHADLAGNLQEWNLDSYQSGYSIACEDCSNLTTASDRVARGGSFYENANFQRTAFRHHLMPSNRALYIGVRCARTP